MPQVLYQPECQPEQLPVLAHLASVDQMAMGAVPVFWTLMVKVPGRLRRMVAGPLFSSVTVSGPAMVISPLVPGRPEAWVVSSSVIAL